MTDIKTLNDIFRRTFSGGRVMLSQGIHYKSTADKAEIIGLVKKFDNFTTANDPYNEHDFGSFEYNGNKIFWKIDYYDLDFRYMSPNPADPKVTNRVMTIMLADEY